MGLEAVPGPQNALYVMLCYVDLRGIRVCNPASVWMSNLSITITGVGSGGNGGELTPPTIYVGILICISPPPQKNLIPSHANCMQHVLRCSERQSDGSEMNTRKPFGGRGSAPHPAEGELTALPQTPQLAGRGWLSPPQEPHPHSKITCSRTYRRSRLLSSSEGILIRDVYDWGCVSLQYASGMSKHNVSSQYRFIRPTYIDGSGFDLKPQCVVDMENKRIILDRCVLVEIWQRYNVCTSSHQAHRYCDVAQTRLSMHEPQKQAMGFLSPGHIHVRGTVAEQ